ncbi:MAG: hypothetical protein AB8E15_04225 [Bdellovibrionales bacterium]
MGNPKLFIFVMLLLPITAFSEIRQDGPKEYRFLDQKIKTQRQMLPISQRVLGIGAYIGGIFVLSRINSGNTALGLAYAVPAIWPFYKYEESQSESFSLTGENVLFSALSLYNFFSLDPAKNSKDEIFVNNVYANLSAWSALYLYRRYYRGKAFFLVPVLAKNTGSIYLQAQF